MNYTHIIIHYAEIGLKGRNREKFERRLIDNIKEKLVEFKNVKVLRYYGRVIVELGKCTQSDLDKISSKLAKTFGISSFLPAVKCSNDLEAINKTSLNLVLSIKDEYQTFKVATKRSFKEFPLNSMEVNKQVGAYLLSETTEKKVDVHNPELLLQIEITEKGSFVCYNKIKGPGGLPVGISGHIMCLLSGGIDSPVAAWQMMKRGCKVDYLHFHSHPYTDRASLDKVDDLVKVLYDWQGGSTMYQVPLIEIQKEVVKETMSSYRIVMYRRFMYRIAEILCKKYRISAIVTGESVGQVASQTLDNILVIDESINWPVIRPLAGHDKEEIIDIAKIIGTYEISIRPHDDCCSLFTPRDPITHGKLGTALKEESKLEVDTLINQALDKIEVIK